MPRWFLCPAIYGSQYASYYVIWAVCSWKFLNLSCSELVHLEFKAVIFLRQYGLQKNILEQV